MTNIEAMQSILGNYQFPDNTYAKALIDVISVYPNCLTLNTTDAYTAANTYTIDMAVVRLIDVVIVNPSAIKEAGYELTAAQADALQLIKKQILTTYGLTIGLANPVVQDASGLW